MEYRIRYPQESEHVILENMLYEAIYQSETVDTPLPYEVIFTPDLFMYIFQWGRNGDYCMVLEFVDKIVGVVWCRTFKGYGFIDCIIPELIIAIVKGYINRAVRNNVNEKNVAAFKNNEV